MQCPYCCSEVRDEALVCMHCRRDIALLRPFVAEMMQLRSVIERHEAAIQSIIAELGTLTRLRHAGVVSDRSLQPRTWLLVCLGVSLEVALYAFGRKTDLLSKTFFMLMAAAPFPLGAWLGRAMPGRQLRRYLSIGAAIAVTSVVGTVVYWWVEVGSIRLPNPDDAASMAMLIVGPTFIFTAGALFGDWLENLSKGGPIPAAATRLADALLPGDGAHRTIGRADRVAKLAATIAAVAPLLTFAGTIATGYLTYLAAMTKPRQEQQVDSPKVPAERLAGSASQSSGPSIPSPRASHEEPR